MGFELVSVLFYPTTHLKMRPPLVNHSVSKPQWGHSKSYSSAQHIKAGISMWHLMDSNIAHVSCLIPQSPSRWFGTSNAVKRHKEHQTSGVHTKRILYILWLNLHHIVFEMTDILLSPGQAVSAATCFTLNQRKHDVSGHTIMTQFFISGFINCQRYLYFFQMVNKCLKRGTQGILSSVHMLSNYLNIWRVNTCNQGNIAAISKHSFKMFPVIYPFDCSSYHLPKCTRNIHAHRFIYTLTLRKDNKHTLQGRSVEMQTLLTYWQPVMRRWLHWNREARGQHHYSALSRGWWKLIKVGACGE